MNVGLLIPGFSDGEQDWCIPVYLNLVRMLARKNAVRVFTLRYPPRRDRYAVFGAQVFSMGGHWSTWGVRRWNLLMRTVAAIVRQHRRQPFHVLHAIWADETGFAACIAGKLIGVPVLVSVAGGELVALPGYGLQAGRVSRWLVAQALIRADGVTAPCQYAADLIRQAGLSPHRLVIVPLGVDTQLFHPSDSVQAPNRLLAVGSLTTVKRHDHLLDVLARLPGVALDIVGDGPQLSALQARARSHGIADRVTFHGAVSHDALPHVYQQATLHILTSWHEAFGMVVIEAAACGIPSVGYALGVLPELPGVAVVPGDKDALAVAIRDLFADSNKRITMGESARRLVEAHYSLDTMMKGMEDTYAQLADNGVSSHSQLA